MLKVQQYGLPIAPSFSLVLPADYECLGIDVIGGQPFLSCLINPLDTASRECSFVVLRKDEPTEHKAHQLSYIGSFATRAETIQYYVFELLK